MSNQTTPEATKSLSPFWRFINGVPDLFIAGSFLLLWISPFALGPDGVKRHLMIMLLEFIVIHSAVFMGAAGLGTKSFSARLAAVGGFGVFYSAFVLGFSLAFHTWWPLIGFWGLTLNRLISYTIAGKTSPEQTKGMMRAWGANCVFYVIGCFLTVLVPLPKLGLTGGVVGSLHLPGKGLWISEPHRVIAFGFIYFAAQATFELLSNPGSNRLGGTPGSNPVKG
ncbi:MAG: hypothetical protein K1X53_17585 [Candidatus Sumerlaeaceae bacterium]|nr:hypothetical protein [Candidatus Sumerlaeaceae bacterium]